MAEEAHRSDVERPIAMKGQGSFAGGKLQAYATVARGFRRTPAKPGADGHVAQPRRSSRDSWFSLYDEENDPYGDFSLDYGTTEEEQQEAIERYMRFARSRIAAGSPMPPVTLQIQFENTSSETMVISPREVNSTLGNFAARPTSLTLAPGERGTLEPMISQLGVTNDEIPLTLGVKIGEKTETIVVPIRNLFLPSVRK